MNKHWKEFWSSTFSYFYPENTLDVLDQTIPQWLNTALNQVFDICCIVFAIIFVIVIAYPVSILKMLYLTPKRIKMTMENIRNDK